MVVMPTLLTSVEGVAELLEHLEVLALGNLDPRVHFAILSDFTDAPALEMPEDGAILAAARAGVEALNARHSEGRNDRFFLFHRERQWNPGEGVFMGWERKRGKIEEFNRLLRGATDTSFTVEVGDLAVLPARALLHHARLRHAPAARRGEEADRHHRPPAQPAALRRAPRPRDRGLRHPAAARQRHHGERRRLAASRGSTRGTPASTPTRRPSRTPTRTSSARASSPARGCTTSTPSWPRSTDACPRTRCCRTTCSRASTPAPPSSPTSKWWTTIRPACWRTRGASTAGCAATGRSCGGCSRSSRRARA